MTDRELLELAAKAAGISRVDMLDDIGDNGGIERFGWNPLKSDGDALRLAVKLCIQVDPLPLETFVGWTFIRGQHQRGKETREFHDGDEMAATRRAIVRAAAAIGKAMP